MNPGIGIQISMRYENFKISKSFKFIFITFLTIFMLDFGYKFKNTNINVALKYAYIIVFSLGVFFVLVAVILDIHMFQFSYSYLYIIQYSLTIFILLCCGQDRSLYSVLEHLYFIDYELYFQNTYKIEIVVFCSMFLTLITNICLRVLACNFISCQNLFGEYLLISIMRLGLNYSLLFNFLLFYSVYFRLKKLRYLVENNCSEIVSYQFLYKFLIDSTEKAKEVFDYFVSSLKFSYLIACFFIMISEPIPSILLIKL